MFVSLLGIMITLLIVPFSSATIQLHICFFFLGMGTAITDTGCQLMTRKLHGRPAFYILTLNGTLTFLICQDETQIQSLYHNH
jgi:hypothetical protein